MSIFKTSLISLGAIASIIAVTYSFADPEASEAGWSQTSNITCNESTCVENISFPETTGVKMPVTGGELFENF